MEQQVEKVRVDRWLWATRLFKTRSLAADACRGGKVSSGGEKLKPSSSVRVGQLMEVSKDGIEREVRVKALLLKRVGAKEAPLYLEDLTPPERFEQKRETLAQRILRREAGSGRPTKRDRRDIEKVFGE